MFCPRQQVQLRFKLRKKVNKFFKISNVCTFVSNDKIVDSNIVNVKSIVVRRRMYKNFGCDTPYWRL